jgi:hypothetical protein
MRLALLLAAALALAPGVLPAQPLSFGYDVRRPGPDDPGPSLAGRLDCEAGPFRGRLAAGLVPDPAFGPEYDLSLGLVPALGETELGLTFDLHLEERQADTAFTLALAHPLEPRADLDARFRLDPEGETARAEARAALRLPDLRLGASLARSFRLDGPAATTPLAFGLTADRLLGPRSAFDLGLRDLGDPLDCAEFKLRLRF